MRKKIILWGFGTLFILFLAIVLILPTLIDSSSLKQKIQTAVNQKNIGTIDYEKAYLKIIPLPHLCIEKIKFSVIGGTLGHVENLMIYPELLPLFRGQVRVSKICLDTPEFTVVLSDKPSEKNDSGKKSSQLNLSQRLTDAVAPLAVYSSGLKISIDKGSINLTTEDKQKIEIRDLDLDADIDINGPRLFDANLNVVSTGFTIKQADKTVVIDCDRLKTKLSVDEDNVVVSLADFRLAQPALKLSGHFTASPDTKGFSLDLNGKDLDVKAISDVALSLGGENETVTDIFSYLKSGRIPHIHVQSKSKDLSTLGDLDNMIIQGRLQHADISIDDIKMQLAEVTGDALIAKGLLEASEASAKLGKTTGHDGLLKIGLAEGNETFHLDIVLNAQLDEVPSVLEKIVDPGTFLQELSLIKNIKGTSTARLVLGESLDALNTKIDISEMAFSADYQRLPFPIEIRRGKLLYQENMVSIEDLDGGIGKSMFSEIFCNASWEKNIDIDIPNGRIKFDLSELYPLISSFDTLRETLADVKKVNGDLELSALRLIIPHDINDASEQWQLSATGEVKEVTINTTQLPEPLHLVSGKIQVAADQLLFKNLNVQLMDAVFDMTGTIFGNIRHPDRVKASLSGDLGEKAVLFFAQSGYLPSAYAVHAPVKFANTDILWQAPKNLSFRGNVSFPKNVELFSDFHYQTGELTVNRLDIKDKESDATLVFDLQKNMIKVRFNGFLHNKTLGRIFVLEKVSDGWLKGDLQVAFVKDKLSESTVQGQLEGGNLLVPLTKGEPLVIDKLSLVAQDNRIAVNHFLITQQENRVDLKGRVDLNADGFVLDLDASAGVLKWSASEKTPVKAANAQQDKSKKYSWQYPVTGAIHLAAKSFTWENYTWKPFVAEISRIKDGVNVEVSESQLCGIDSVGTLQMTGDELALDFQLTAKDQDIAPRYACLTKDRIQMTGLFDLTAQIKARGKPGDLLRSACGHYDFTARKGQITQDKILSRILEVVNFTQIVRGNIPDLKSKGFNYESIVVQAEFADDMMIFTKIYMDGKTLDLIGKGKLDLKQKILNVELLAAPFKTVDSIIKNIPGVNYLMAGNLISIPVRVKGDVSDPKVSIMSASDVRSNLLDFARRTIKSSIKLIETMNPYKKKEQK